MSGRPRQIVAFGGGGFSMEAGNPLLDSYVLQVVIDLAQVVASRPQARAYRVEAVAGVAIETPLQARYLGVADPVAALA